MRMQMRQARRPWRRQQQLPPRASLEPSSSCSTGNLLQVLSSACSCAAGHMFVLPPGARYPIRFHLLCASWSFPSTALMELVVQIHSCFNWLPRLLVYFYGLCWHFSVAFLLSFLFFCVRN
uniref:Uncharacterized protein n=1 Tax=Setaria viridis TaxID=4556 RepID=A0A4U6T036_SETVI|nr:hypothetical protein SEVIR_9G256600v2 [Setaria viridis]